MKQLKIALLAAFAAGLCVLLYGVINWITFLNLIESPLPESQEKVPDLEIVPE